MGVDLEPNVVANLETDRDAVFFYRLHYFLLVICIAKSHPTRTRVVWILEDVVGGVVCDGDVDILLVLRG
jgi:hypothetical protein